MGVLTRLLLDLRRSALASPVPLGETQCYLNSVPVILGAVHFSLAAAALPSITKTLLALWLQNSHESILNMLNHEGYRRKTSGRGHNS